jgi:hypothetical protein
MIRAADDFPTIRARLEEQRRERIRVSPDHDDRSADEQHEIKMRQDRWSPYSDKEPATRQQPRRLG